MVQMKARQENHTLIQVPPDLQKEEYTDSKVPEHQKTSPNMHMQKEMLSVKTSANRSGKNKKS
eukprot:1797373-Ditylum_brightwellii.AAC.1